MVKKLHKTISFRMGLLASALAALIVGYTQRNSLHDVTTTVLDNPIFGIEKVYADDGSSGCSGSACDGGGTVAFVNPADSNLVFDVQELSN